jgi:glycosyltransferase involved in cell wall biosynthesis
MESIITQSYTNLEIIIIDDGSTDNSINTIKDLMQQDNRIRYIYQSNRGKPAAMNHGLRILKGEYWLIQDADDISYRERIEKQYLALKNDSALAAVFCNNDIILNDNRIFAPTCMSITPEVCKSMIDVRKVPAHDATGMYRAKIVADILFDEEMWLIEGVDYVIRVGELHKITVISECLYSHRVNYKSITHTKTEKIGEAVKRLNQKIDIRRCVQSKNERIVKKKENILFEHRRYDTVLPYAMESVVQQRLCGNWTNSLRTSLICLRLHPLDWYYYKPLVYSLIPLKMISLYRKIKKLR